MKIINLIDNYNIINKGIWGSVLVLEEELTPLGIICEYWGPKILSLPEEFKNKEVLFFTRNLLKDLKKISENDISTTLIHSHSSWGYNNILAYFLSRKGYKWVFSPHGTLEPWALVQKQLKKKIYLNLIGNKIFSKANYIRAVSKPEEINLKNLFPHKDLITIPNGIKPFSYHKKDWSQKKYVLFMGRLHKKKGIHELVQAWAISNLNNSSEFELLIAGLDEGELSKIEGTIEKNSIQNISYIGFISGLTKVEVLKKVHFFILPSYSEGFPTSVLESISAGCFPIISDGCNFPELIKNNYAIRVEVNKESINNALNEISNMDLDKLLIKIDSAKIFIDRNYSLKNIAQMQQKLFSAALINC